MTALHYVGRELDLFAHASNWKRYWSSRISPLISGDVLEVGAGLGANTPLLYPSRARSWTCLEPDPDLAKRLQSARVGNPQAVDCATIVGTTESLEARAQFDAILYIDVLEHIEHDREELARASNLLRTGGMLIVLSPAHQWLYTPFDAAIGHFRRYNRTSLAGCSPPSCAMEQLVYLDSVGMLASLGNYLFLQQSTPTLRQILFWDRYLVRSSTILDALLFHSLGKSILGVWRKL